MLSVKTYLKEVCLQARILKKAFLRFGVAAVAGSGALTGAVAPEARLYGKVIRKDGREEDLGLLGTKVVTTAFVNFVVDQLQTETSEFGDFKYHDSGTGGTAENVTDTGLETKVETGRATGTQTEGASANIYRSVGTITYTATRSIVEHGLFSQSAGGTLMDRTVFASVGVDSGDSIQFTYELTIPAGS